MSILAQQEKEGDLDNSFGNENCAHNEREKNDPKQRINYQIDRSHAVQRGYEHVPPESAASGRNAENEMTDACQEKKPA